MGRNKGIDRFALKDVPFELVINDQRVKQYVIDRVRRGVKTRAKDIENNLLIGYGLLLSLLINNIGFMSLSKNTPLKGMNERQFKLLCFSYGLYSQDVNGGFFRPINAGVFIGAKSKQVQQLVFKELVSLEYIRRVERVEVLKKIGYMPKALDYHIITPYGLEVFKLILEEINRQFKSNIGAFFDLKIDK